MPFHEFTIPATGASDRGVELDRFLQSRKILSTRKTLQQIDGILCWLFRVEYLGPEGDPPTEPDGGR